MMEMPKIDTSEIRVVARTFEPRVKGAPRDVAGDVGQGPGGVLRQKGEGWSGIPGYSAPREVEAPVFAPTPARRPAVIPPREWLYGHHLIRKYVSATIAPGGLGKSTLTLCDAVAMASGRPLLGVKPHGRLRVWMWNGEDPRDELERRLEAALMHYGMTWDDIDGWLFIDSGRDTPIRIDNGRGIAMPVVEGLVAALSERQIDVLIVDPFVSVHTMPENDNVLMNAVVKAFALVADRANCAIDLVHHSRKLNGAEADIDAARGGSAIAGAVRAARALNPMSADVAKPWGIPEQERRLYVRVDDAKSNLAPPSAARWFKLVSVALGNATQDRPEDYVGVAEPWKPRDPLEGLTAGHLLAVQRAIDGRELREDSQATAWVGREVGRILGWNPDTEADKLRVKNAIKTWIASGALVVEVIQDKKKGRETKVIAVGEWATPP